MKSFFHFFRKAEPEEKSGKFSDFFLHAPEAKKRELLKEVARQANEEQQEILQESHLKTEAR